MLRESVVRVLADGTCRSRLRGRVVVGQDFEFENP